MTAVALVASTTAAYAANVGSIDLVYDVAVPGGGLIVEGGSLAGRHDLVVNNSVSIDISTVPPGATVEKAFLYWVVMGGIDGVARFNGHLISAQENYTAGTTCWDSEVNTAYRADVTALVPGNGTYVVESLPSTTDPAGPDTDGVALLVVYKDVTSSQFRRVIVHDGLITTLIGSAVAEDVEGVFDGLASPGNVPGRLTLVVGDGQQVESDGSVALYSSVVADPVYSGTSGSLWDIQSFDVTVFGGVASAPWQSGPHASDCLAFTVAALDYDEGFCGDGHVSSTEECDAGAGIDDQCCTAECEFAEASAACDNGDSCGGDSCDASGTCIAGTDPGGCDDANPCTLDTCNGQCSNAPEPDPTCLTGDRSLLLVSGLASTLKWKISRGPELEQVDFGSPETTTPYSICVYDASAGATSLPMQLDIAPSAAWIVSDPDGYAYNDPSGSLDGLLKARIKTGAAGRSKLTLVAKGADLPLPLPFSDYEFFDADPSVIIQLRSDVSSLCLGSEFSASPKNVLGMYVGKAP